MGHQGGGTAVYPARESDLPRSELYTDMRQKILRLALDEDDPDRLRSRIDEEISNKLGRMCSFFDGDGISESIPGCETKVVRSGIHPIGMLVLGPRGQAAPRLSDEELQEAADLVGLTAIIAAQGRELISLQNESEDMLFHAPDAICVLSLEGTIQMANRRALEFVDREANEVEGCSLGEVLGWHAPSPKELLEIARCGEKIEINISGPMGSSLASLTFSEVGEEDSGQILCVMRDITKERQAQLALRRSERSSLMGETVEYLLHEMNNPLAALLSNAGVAEKRIEELGRELGAHRKVSYLRNERTAEAVEQFIARSARKMQQIESAVAGVRTAGVRMQNTMLMLRALRQQGSATGPEEVDVGFELGLAIGAAQQEADGLGRIFRSIDSLPKVEAIPFQLAEAFSALIKNAVQAIQDNPEGKVLVSAQTVASHVQIVIEDNGPGVPDELREKIFMPFFTTKPLGLALGLGLTMAEDTVRRALGSIALDSTYEGGARFVVTLPERSTV